MDSQEPLTTQHLSDSDCDDVRESFLRFLCDFRPSDTAVLSSPGEVGQQRGYYAEMVQDMVSSGGVTLFVEFQHLDEFSSQLGDNVFYQHHRLDRYLRAALFTVIKDLDEGYAEKEGQHREFFVGFLTKNSSGVHSKLRDLRTESVGKLRSFTATVTRTSGVRPELFLGTFKCGECGVETSSIEQHFRYTQPVTCSNQACGNRKLFELVREKSIFVDWQKVKVQELSDEIPAGSLPRTMEVILRADNVEKARAGDKVTFIGNPIVVPDVAAISAPGERVQMQPGRQGNANQEGITGMKNLGSRELTYKLAFLACATEASESRLGAVNVRADDIVGMSREEALGQFSSEQQAHILSMANNPSILRDLGRSVAPGVFGHESVKRAVLLMLLGGVHKTTAEGINLRGDINVAIVGDPSCAKSQMLKYVAAFLPRAVYTSGKSSSAAGLTASVVKDSDSGEFCIEAGALMLADNGICCIDEFDKMDQKDQVAIHEAMEQQTISIAKAGIQATLNARTSILAAANPVGGRYDRSKPLRHNVALPPAILSRFDLLHVMIDEPDEFVDTAIAKHILAVHRQQARVLDVPYTLEQMQRYICFARSIRPQLTSEAKEELVQSYKKLRTEDAAPGSSTAYRMTVRQLEALIRLSEAIARATCNSHILPEYVLEARRLMKASRIDVTSAEQDLQDDEDGSMADPDGVLRTVELYRQQQQQNQRPASGAERRGEEEDGQAGPSGAPGPSAQLMESEDQNGQHSGEGREEGGGGDIPDPAALAARLQKGPTRVTQAKIDQVKAVLFQKLKDPELRGDSTREVWGDEVAVMPQHKLLEAYFAEQIDRGVYASTDELEADIELVNKIVTHLIRHGDLQEAFKPPQMPNETALAYKRRCHKERELCISPNLVE